MSRLTPLIFFICLSFQRRSLSAPPGGGQHIFRWAL